MNLIGEIIAALTSESADLNTALLRTKVLLHQLGEKQLVRWVNAELKGYSPDDELPDYRVIDVEVLGNISNGAWRYSEQPLPLRHLPEKLRRNLETTYLRQSIAVLQKYAADESNLAITIAPEIFPHISKAFSGGYNVERAWGQPSSGIMLQVVNEVRTRLLDFILELSEELPDSLTLNEIKEKATSIDVPAMFKNSVFGHNTTIIVGDNNVQNAKNNVVERDFQSLAQFLKDNGVPADDIDTLSAAIEADKDAPELAEKKFGLNVSKWFASMMDKAASATWDMNVGVASSLLATALNSFYGWF